MARIGIFLGVVAFIAISGSVQAACGGGGYKVSKASSSQTDPRYDPQNTVRSNVNLSETKRDDGVTVIRADQIQSSSSSAQNVAYRTDLHLYDKSHVDSVRGRMDLTSNQDAVLEKVSSDFRKKGENLRLDFDEAKKKLDNCKGECPDERKKVAEARSALEKLDHEYERKMSRFLSSSQLDTFRNTSVSSTQDFK